MLLQLSTLLFVTKDVETGAQKRRMDEFREQIEKMQVIERALLVTRSASVGQTIQSALVTGVLSNVLGLLAICALVLLYRRYLASRAAQLSGKTLANALGQPIRSELTLLDSVSDDNQPRRLAGHWRTSA